MKNCSSCGKPIAPNVAFCTSCGTRVLESSNEENCSSCGKPMTPNAAFCTSCGVRIGENKTQGAQSSSPIGNQLIGLANEFLAVRQINPQRFDFSSETGTQSPAQKIKIKYEGIALLEPENKKVVFWDKMVESSVGMNMGMSFEKRVQVGVEVDRKVGGHLLFGGKYGFEYGQLRKVVKSIAAEQGWDFKTVIFKPKQK